MNSSKELICFRLLETQSNIYGKEELFLLQTRKKQSNFLYAFLPKIGGKVKIFGSDSLKSLRDVASLFTCMYRDLQNQPI